jgi:Ca2+-binding RTX toxin-like protein
MRPARPFIALACAATFLAVAAPAASAKVTSSFNDRVLNVNGGNGDDQVTLTCGVDGNAKVNGGDPDSGPIACSKVVEIDATTGAGNDTVDYSGINEAFGEATFPGFGTRTGAAAVMGLGNDEFTPSPEAFNLVYGEDGKDRIRGGPVRDLLSGGAGNDSIRGADGRDSLLGNGGNDKLFGEEGADTISGHAGNDLLSGDEGADFLGGGSGRDRLRGGPGRDRLLGGTGADALNGGPGKDIQEQDPPKEKKKP